MLHRLFIFVIISHINTNQVDDENIYREEPESLEEREAWEALFDDVCKRYYGKPPREATTEQVLAAFELALKVSSLFN